MPVITPPTPGKVLVTYGLPASGKSTLAKQMVRDAKPGTLVRINKDDMRAQLHAGQYHGRTTEDQIEAARDALVDLHLAKGVSVIVDDTNLAPRHGNRLAELAWERSADFEVIDLTDVPAEECIRRDALRGDAKVGEDVIRGMVKNQLKLKRRSVGHEPAKPAPAFNPDLPSVYLCDIDGTLAHIVPGGRSPYDFKRVGEDLPDWSVIDTVSGLVDAGRKVILFSGRKAYCREQTREWLARFGVPDLELFMRADNDNRRDSFIKYDLYNEHIRDRFNVTAIFDDRDQVVRTWRMLGLTCYQVAPGPF